MARRRSTFLPRTRAKKTKAYDLYLDAPEECERFTHGAVMAYERAMGYWKRKQRSKAILTVEKGDRLMRLARKCNRDN